MESILSRSRHDAFCSVTKQICIITFIILLLVNMGWAKEIIEYRIGLIDLSHPPKESEIILKFGKGYEKVISVNGKILEKSHCYYLPKDEIWVEISLSHVLNKNLERSVQAVLVSREKLCDESFIPEMEFDNLTTSKGIKIGDSFSKVTEAYGEPSIDFEAEKEKNKFSAITEMLKPKKGRILRYLGSEDDEFFSEFLFDKNELNSMYVSGAE